jgi:nickel-dependent lactate racemase
MTAAEACVKPGGVIIMAAACNDGHGGEGFYRWFANRTPDAVAAAIAGIGQLETLPDQWQAQILARVLQKARVIMVTDDECSPELIAAFSHASRRFTGKSFGNGGAMGGAGRRGYGDSRRGGGDRGLI